MATSSQCFSSIPKSVESDLSSLVVVSFYKFADFPDHGDFRKPLKDVCEELRVSGGIILAPEGINGSICGSRESVERVLAFIRRDNRLNGLRQVETPVSSEKEEIHHGHSSSFPLAAGEDAPFRWDHSRKRLLRLECLVSLQSKELSPEEWNELITDPETVSEIKYQTVSEILKKVHKCQSGFVSYSSEPIK